MNRALPGEQDRLVVIDQRIDGIDRDYKTIRSLVARVLDSDRSARPLVEIQLQVIKSNVPRSQAGVQLDDGFECDRVRSHGIPDLVPFNDEAVFDGVHLPEEPQTAP